jgi:hypothetical protein
MAYHQQQQEAAGYQPPSRPAHSYQQRIRPGPFTIRVPRYQSSEAIGMKVLEPVLTMTPPLGNAN